MKYSSGCADRFSWTYLDILEDEVTILTTIPASRGPVFGIAGDYQAVSVIQVPFYRVKAVGASSLFLCVCYILQRILLGRGTSVRDFCRFGLSEEQLLPSEAFRIHQSQISS